MSEFNTLAALRHSTRIFDPSRAVPSQALNDILEAARLAPSACNRQPWRFYVVTNPEVRKAMLSASRPSFVDAPVLIAAVGLHSQAWHRPSDGKDHTDVDVSIAVEHICLAAAAEGLATCWVCSFAVGAVRDALQLGEDEEPIALIPLGYAAPGEAVAAKTRKPMQEIVKYVE